MIEPYPDVAGCRDVINYYQGADKGSPVDAIRAFTWAEYFTRPLPDKAMLVYSNEAWSKHTEYEKSVYIGDVYCYD